MEKTLPRPTTYPGNNGHAFHVGVPSFEKLWNSQQSHSLPQVLRIIRNINQAFLALILSNKLINFSFGCGASRKDDIRESRTNGFYSTLEAFQGASPAMTTERSIAAGFQSFRLDTGYLNPEGHGAAFKVLYYVKELVKWQKK